MLDKMAASIGIAAYWIVAPCSLAEIDRGSRSPFPAINEAIRQLYTSQATDNVKYNFGVAFINMAL